MEFEKIHNKGQARLFRSRYLEYLTKANPLVIWGMYVPVIIVMLYISGDIIKLDMVRIIFSFVAGIIFWTLFEYIAHRFLFHFISESEKAMKVVYILHGNHHEYPRDKERLFMPPVPSLIAAITVFTLLYFTGRIFNIQEFVYSFFAGFLLGYLIYGSMHYAIHAWNPPYKWMKSLWRNHHLHHYKHGNKGFGVSSTFWDRLFGTMYDLKNEKVDQTKVKELMF